MTAADVWADTTPVPHARCPQVDSDSPTNTGNLAP